MLKNLIFLLFIIFFTFSCVSNKKIIYLQNKAISQDSVGNVSLYKRFTYKVQINDIIQVVVRSKSPIAASFFNIVESSNGIGGISEGSNYINGYSVSDSGSINIPNIGQIKVVGLTIDAIKVLVEAKVKEYINDAFVIVKLSGINFSVIGVVNRPGRYIIYSNQLTIFEALANAGDLPDIANRQKVKLIRQYPDGIRTHLLDLTDKDVISSPYYFIQPNDLIYIQPLKIRSIGIGTTGFSALQGVVSVLSVILLVITLSRYR